MSSQADLFYAVAALLVWVGDSSRRESTLALSFDAPRYFSSLDSPTLSYLHQIALRMKKEKLGDETRLMKFIADVELHAKQRNFIEEV